MSVVEIIIKTIDQSGGNVGKLNGELGKLAAKYLSVSAVATTAYMTIQESMRTTLEYADSVRQLSLVSGESTEATSRFIQVLDDYGITTADVLAVTRSLTKEGLSPTIETLAELSDQYLALNSVEEKNEFVMKNLGRGGLQWIEVLGKGSKAIKEQGAAISQSLVLSQKGVAAAREYELALDEWNDAIMGLKVSLGNALIPQLLNLNNAIKDEDRGLEILRESYSDWEIRGLSMTEAGRKIIQSSRDQAAAEREAARATEELSKAAQDGTTAQDDFAAALKATSDANNELISLVGQMQSSETSYNAEVKRLAEERTKIEQDRAEAIRQGWWVSSEKVKEYDQALANNALAVDELAVAHDLATKQIVLDLMTQKFTADGNLTDDEMNWLLEKGEAWGIYTADVVADAKIAIDWANKITQSVNNIPEEKTITINQVFNPIANAGKIGGRAAGGPVTAGVPYWVGERGIPELFVPRENGTVMTQAQAGGGGTDSIGLAAAIMAGMPTERGIAKAIARELDMRGLARR